MNNKDLIILGLMSGSSMDGMDLAVCQFQKSPHLKWKVLHTHSLPLSDLWKQQLSETLRSPVSDYFRINAGYGMYLGRLLKKYSASVEEHIDYLAIHGHTLIHNPTEKFSIQMGSGAHVAAAAGIPVIDQFRIQDILAGGQGAPLAHIADMDLFPGYDYYLNLGGIANISISDPGGFQSYDVCGANQILNTLANRIGKNFDEGGQMASRGSVFETLLSRLLDHPFLNQAPPKSLDNQYTWQEFSLPFERINLSIEDKLATATEFIARSIAHAVNRSPVNLTQRMLVTGGGGLNSYLMQRIRALLPQLSIEIPDMELLEFKEAILMAYCGALRIWGQPNCRSVVTGATRDTVNGTIHYPQSYFVE